MPSAYECFGIAAVEALGAGVPVIVSPMVGVSGTIVKHCAGTVAAPEPENLARTLRSLASSRSELERMAQASSTAAAEFSTEKHGARLESEYGRLLQSAQERRWRNSDEAHR